MKMKKQVSHFASYFYMLLFLLLACTPKGDNGMQTKDSAHVFQDAQIRQDNPIGIDGSVLSEEFLTIYGKDIWVRDEPGTGKVIMKLNEEDQCKVIRHKQFEIIRGQGGYWYEIEVNNQRGWVFGTQTSLGHEVQPREFSTLADIANAFVFNSDDNPDWDGDKMMVSTLGTYSENGFALVSFDSPSPMGAENFSHVGFQENGFGRPLEFLVRQLSFFINMIYFFC